MGIHREVYDFAAKAGALEGYVYPREKVDPQYFQQWVKNLVAQYQALPDDVRKEFQDLCNGTLGRAVRSLIPLLGEEHEVVGQLKGLIQGELPTSPDEFPRTRYA